jgi:hypothetical protein
LKKFRQMKILAEHSTLDPGVEIHKKIRLKYDDNTINLRVFYFNFFKCVE